MGAQRTRKQHFVPRFYLSGFSGEEGKLWVHDSECDVLRYVTPENTAYETNIYTPTDENGTRIDAVESALAEIENIAARIMPKLISLRSLDRIEKLDFSAFLATMFARSPAQLREFATFYGKMTDQAISRIFDLERCRKELAGIFTDGDALAQEILSNKDLYELNVDRRVGLIGFKFAEKMMEVIAKMTWSFEISDNIELITSDNSVFWVNGGPESLHQFEGFGLSHRQAVIPFPLSPNIILRLDWIPVNEWAKWRLTKQKAKLSNQYQAKHKERFLYFKTRDDGVRRLGMKYSKPAQRIDVGTETAHVSVVRRLNTGEV